MGQHFYYDRHPSTPEGASPVSAPSENHPPASTIDILGTILNLMKYYDLERDILEVARRIGVSTSAIFKMISSEVI